MLVKGLWSTVGLTGDTGRERRRWGSHLGIPRWQRRSKAGAGLDEAAALMVVLGLATSARAGAALAIGLVAAQARAAFKGARGLGRHGTEAWWRRARTA